MRSKLLKLLDAAQKGLSVNETVTPENLLIFVNGVLETQLPPELEAIKEAEDEAQGALEGKEGWICYLKIPSSFYEWFYLDFFLCTQKSWIKYGIKAWHDLCMP